MIQYKTQDNQSVNLCSPKICVTIYHIKQNTQKEILYIQFIKNKHLLITVLKVYTMHSVVYVALFIKQESVLQLTNVLFLSFSVTFSNI